MKRTRILFLICSALALGACGGNSGGHVSGGGSGGSGGGGAGGGGGAATGGNGVALVPATAQLGTYIVLGDSISDKGGSGPFFYDQLAADLTTRYPGLMLVHAAQGGAIVDNYSDNQPTGVPLLTTEVAGLGHSYPGDVLITITIGGNDLNAHAVAAILGTDATVRGEFDSHLAAVLTELTTPGRLGSGKVYVVVANIYDFTDGMGDFSTVHCGPNVNVNPMVVKSTFGTWNGVISSNVEKVGGALYDMHADFTGHGYNNSNAADVWYDSASCIHPNGKGHDAIRKSIYGIVTGQALP